MSYEGYLKPYKKYILRRHDAGKKPSKIADELWSKGVKSNYGIPVSSGMITYILTREGRYTPRNAHDITTERRKRRDKIYADYKAGMKVKDLTARYGVNRGRIYSIIAHHKYTAGSRVLLLDSLPVRAANLVRYTLDGQVPSRQNVAKLSKADIMRTYNFGKASLRALEKWLLPLKLQP